MVKCFNILNWIRMTSTKKAQFDIDFQLFDVCMISRKHPFSRHLPTTKLHYHCGHIFK